MCTETQWLLLRMHTIMTYLLQNTYTQRHKYTHAHTYIHTCTHTHTRTLTHTLYTSHQLILSATTLYVHICPLLRTSSSPVSTDITSRCLHVGQSRSLEAHVWTSPPAGCWTQRTCYSVVCRGQICHTAGTFVEGSNTVVWLPP